MKKILSTILVICMIISITACNSSSADNRESAVTNETQNTVNPDVSEPNQSIPSDAMITETETESTAPVKNGNTYTINGVEYTISVSIEDYLYDLPGSDFKYIDLDGFMEAYGFKTSDETVYKELRGGYANSDGVGVSLHINNSSIYSKGLPVCSFVNITYPSSFSIDGAIGGVTMSRDFPLDEENHVYVVNGYVENGKTYEKYCVSQEMLVVFAVAFDTLNETSSTAPAVETLSRACECITEGDGVKNVHIV